MIARRQYVIGAAAVLAAFALGLLLGRTIAPDSGSRTAPNSQPVVSAERGKAQRRPFQERRSENAERPEEEEPKNFSYRRLRLDTGTATPKACLQFNRDLNDSGDVNYGDFVRVSPADGSAIEVDGTSLCLTGLEFDKDYRVRLRAGLPSAKGDRLERTEEVTVAFGDKPSYAGFAGDGVILPRLEADGIGIETVNVEKVEIKVYRVSDRSLARKNIVAGEASGEDQYSYVWDQEDGQDVGVEVWKGEIATPGERNETTTTVFALGAALGELTPGAYFLRLKDVSPGADEYRAAQAWRWILFTDMALTTYSGADGIDVFVRSISTARAMAGVELSLIAANNDILATAITNADGRAHFAEEAVNGDYPLTPRMLMAYGPQDDYAALDLDRAPLDLSDRDVGGRAAPSKVDAFVYLDRGIYRPGETVHVSGLLRDDAGKAIENRPLTVTIRRPNGTEADKRRIDELTVGGFTFDYDVPDAAPRGMWNIQVEADGVEGFVGAEQFSVEDFVPQRLEVKLEGDEKTPIRPGETREMSVESRFLYGAPASGLAVEAEARLRLDPNPFPDFSGYRFGPVNGRFDERFLTLPNTTTDAAGEASVAINVDDAPKNYGAPMRADVVVGVVEPGGRVVRESARIPVRPDDAYVGLKLANDASSFGQGEEVGVNAVLIDWQGQLIAGDVEWRLVEEDYWFDWYRENGQWRWRRSFRDVLVAEGRGKTGPDEIATLVNQRIDPGTYRLTVSQAGGKAKSDIRFYVGWRSYAAGADSPDQAALTLQNDKVTPGSRARLFLNPPYEGEATIVIATDKVQLVQRMGVEAKGREIIVDTDPSWGAGFYVMATVVTPRDPGDRPVPRRAMAVSYVPFDMSARKLDVAIEDPDVFRPRQRLDLPVTVSGAAPGATVMMTVAAVDEGILRLTKFASPDPVDYYYGKKRLGVDVRDDYGRILDANLGAAARFGGDSLGGEGLTVVPTKSVALFTGPVTVGAGGKTTVPIEVPDFNGELRLMAVAWSKEKLGSDSEALTVRDPVPAELALPRFLAPGDVATATLLIDNVDGEAGDYKVSLTGEGPVDISSTHTFTLASSEKQTQTFSFETGEVGIGAVNLSVEGPGGFSVSRSYPIQSRTPYFPVTEVRTAALEPGETFQLTDAVTAPYVEGSADVTVSFSRLDGVEPGPLLDALYRYPYGCSEQLTSSAMPLLFVDVLGGEVGKGPERAVRPRVQKAVNELLNRQSPDGAFGLWRVGDSWASPWLGAYVTDFLYRAKNEGYGVPDDALARAYDSLEDIARVDRWYLASYQTNVPEFTGNNDTREFLKRRSAAYALYVLARAGRADLSDLRYFHDALLEGTPSPLARAHIGAALAMMGDRARANSAFEQAMQAVGWQNRGDYYQTNLRDVAGLVALAVEAGQTDKTEALVEQLKTYMKDPKAMHTQEKAFTLLAAQALLRTSEAVELSVNGQSLADLPPAPSFTPNEAEIDDGVAYRNDGEGQIFRSLTVSGSPTSAPPATQQGFTLTKRIATRDGRPADLSAVRQNDRLVVVISGTATDQRLHPAVIADLLPAGLEIEAILNPDDAGGAGNNGPYKWAGALSYPKVAEARDDRFVAAVDVRGGDRFTLAYVVRAVTPGEFVMPGAVIEDMYRPGEFARTEVGRLSVAAAE
ncbi:alpha-2-macroglobulin family protein [Hyphococcus sp.]|uniref:alpha-2-macroglobulin family protein n=1 Tax=Hyphococcus sp. TaxID=2038636 RepID=UPI003D0D9111